MTERPPIYPAPGDWPETRDLHREQIERKDEALRMAKDALRCLAIMDEIGEPAGCFYAFNFKEASAAIAAIQEALGTATATQTETERN